MEKQEKIYIAGPKGLISSALQRVLQKQGYTQIISRTNKELDLLDSVAVADFFNSEKPDYVFLPSYKSGSIQENINQPAEFIYENLVVQNNIIHNAYLNKVKKLLYFGASCVYPKASPQPIKEKYLLTGELEPTSEAYAVAKIAGIKMCRAYNRQYGTKFISVVPATLYGPNDSFDLEKSHVLSSLLRKFYEAKLNNQKEIVLWGTGAPWREFLYADDLVDACIFIINTDCDFGLINIGTGADLTIKELAEKIKKIIGFQGEIKWDTTKPDGAPQKLLDITCLKSLGWTHRVELDEGLEKTYQWFIANYHQITQDKL